jgi:heat shock protein HtpX
MVTLTLIQGVMNTFVYFLSRVVGFMIDSFLRRGGDRSGIGIGYSLSVIVLDILFGILAGIVVAWFSRQREFRADAGAAKLAGSPRTMFAALQRLGNMHPEPLPSNMASSGIAGKGGIASLFATHPSLDDRIEALRRQG